MSDEGERVFDYERQNWVTLADGETAGQALARNRGTTVVEAPAAVAPSGPKESGAARFLLVAGIVVMSIGLLLLLLGVGLVNNSESPQDLVGAAATSELGTLLLVIGSVFVFTVVAIHAFYDIGLRRRR